MSNKAWKQPLPDPSKKPIIDPRESTSAQRASNQRAGGGTSVFNLFRRSKKRKNSADNTEGEKDDKDLVDQLRDSSSKIEADGKASVVSEDSEYEESEIDEPEGYNILEDPDFADLEVKSEFDEAEGKTEEQEEVDIFVEDRQELYDVLDTSAKVIRAKAIDRKMALRGHIPNPPTGGWVWRKAKFLSESTPKEGEGYVWNFEYPLTKEKSVEQISINVTKEPHRVAKAGTKSGLEVLHHKYEEGHKLDILDIFKAKNGRDMKKKWRPATIKALSDDGYWIRIHFDNWKVVWDEWLHIYMDAERISEQSKFTKRIQRRLRRRKTNFKKVLKRKHNLQLVDMEADGNCLFRTVSHQVYGTPKKHAKVRAECCNYMLKNKERFELFTGNIVQHVKKMKRDREWGDDTEIRAMEELYDRRFVIFQVSGLGIQYKPMKIHFKGDLPSKIKDVEPIRLSYHGKCHYNSVIPADIKVARNKSYKVGKKRTTTWIADRRRRIIEKSEEEERKRKLEAKKKEAEEKRQKEEKEEKQEEEDEEDEDTESKTTDTKTSASKGDEESEKEVKTNKVGANDILLDAAETEPIEQPKVDNATESKIVIDVKEVDSSEEENNPPPRVEKPEAEEAVKKDI
eukprot:maker-scaffold_5-snap-gene-11.52-mRNA-1 protein AED:0.00 eAED:0.00 QI:113/0/0.5/1/1/1/2/89/625